MARYYLVLLTTYFQLAYQNEYMPFGKMQHCALYLASVFPLYEWCLVIKALLSFIGMKWNSSFSLCWFWLTELRSKESVPRPLCCQVRNLPSSLALSCRLWPQGHSSRDQFSEYCLHWPTGVPEIDCSVQNRFLWIQFSLFVTQPIYTSQKRVVVF